MPASTSSVPTFLRHVFCVLLINAGVGVDELAELTDMDVEDLTETFRGLLEDAERVRSRPVEQAIADAAAVLVTLSRPSPAR